MSVAHEKGEASGSHRDDAADPAKDERDEPGPEEIWKEPAAQLLLRLATTPAGLDAAQVRSRLASYGPNDAATVKRSPLWLQFLARFRNPLVIILLVASGLSAATGDVASFFIVVTIVTISMTLDFVQEVRAQNAVEALRRSVAVQATVRRDGASLSLPIDQLVPGDIVELIAGDLVPADSRLLESRDLFVNQALLTGEPYPAEKHAWVARMRESMARLTPRFSSNRAVREYTEQHYLPAASAYRRRAAEKGKFGVQIVDWRHALDQKWNALCFGEVKVETRGERHEFAVQVYLGDLDPGAVRVELYADGVMGGVPVRQEMKRVRQPADAQGDDVYTASVSTARPSADYTVRVMPHSDDVAIPLEDARILWQR